MKNMDQPLTMFLVQKWNKKLYKNGEHTSDWFWDNFGIKSGPKFPEYCYSHIPKVWENAVFDMITELQNKYPNLEFAQIKEKFCNLTVYFDLNSRSKKDYKDIRGIVEKYKDRLRNEGLHPPKNEKKGKENKNG